MKAELDRPGAVRPGEELDRARLADFLRDALGLEGEPEVEQFARGYSNLTYLVRAGRREMVLRRPPVGSRVKTAHDMGREHLILSRLRPVYELVPRTLAACAEHGTQGVAGAHWRELVGMFEHGSTANVCAGSYADFFAQAVALVADSCTGFEPPG